MYSVQLSVYSVQLSVYSVQLSVYSVQLSVYSVQWIRTLYTVQCVVLPTNSLEDSIVNTGKLHAHLIPVCVNERKIEIS